MMTGFMGTSAVEAVDFAASVLARGAILLTMAFAVIVLSGRARAALRHHVWALTMAGLVALPFLVAATPDWRIDIPGVAAVETGLATIGQGVGPREGTVAAPATTKLVPEGAAVVGRPPANTGRDGGHVIGRDSQAGPIPSLPNILLAVWMAGVLFLLGRLLVGGVRAARLVRRADIVTDSRWNVLVSRLSLRTGLRSSVRLVSCDEVDVPMAWGIFSCWLVLPHGIEDWPEERRRVVVLHELAHFKRRDCLLRAMSELALAIHWVNPLAWLALRRMRSEREQACDDEVLAAGVGGPAYAHHLVDIARGLTRRRQLARAAVAMARPSELENRVLAILDDRRNRSGLGRMAWRGGFLALLALLVPVAMLQPASTAVAPADDAQSDAATDIARTDPTPSELEIPPAAVGQQDTIEERVFRALEVALDSEDPEVRRRVAHTFGTIESPRGVGPLSILLREDPDAGVRSEAAWGLGMIESDEGLDALAVAVGDFDAGVREQAVWALGMIESADGVELLLPLLREETAEMRKDVAWSLGMIESAAAVEPLAEAFAVEGVAEVRSEIVWALGMIEDRRALETVADALEDPEPGVRKQALWALGMIMN